MPHRGPISEAPRLYYAGDLIDWIKENIRKKQKKRYLSRLDGPISLIIMIGDDCFTASFGMILGLVKELRDTDTRPFDGIFLVTLKSDGCAEPIQLSPIEGSVFATVDFNGVDLEKLRSEQVINPDRALITLVDQTVDDEGKITSTLRVTAPQGADIEKLIDDLKFGNGLPALLSE